MSRTTAPDPTTPGDTPARTVWDPRGYYRRALAVVAPIPLAAMGLVYLLQPAPAGGTFEQTYAAVVDNPGIVNALTPLAWLFFAFLIPAVLAAAAVSWRRVPRLTAIAASFCLPAFAAAFGSLPPGSDLHALLTHNLGLDVADQAALETAWWEQPVALISSLLFLVGIVIGLSLLGIALWRSRRVPTWMAIALILGAATHPFLPTNTAQGIGLLVAAVGFSGASLALLRMTNDQFAPNSTPGSTPVV
jgi:hypothetical protein